jgi:hypothetical protein
MRNHTHADNKKALPAQRLIVDYAIAVVESARHLRRAAGIPVRDKQSHEESKGRRP